MAKKGAGKRAGTSAGEESDDVFSLVFKEIQAGIIIIDPATHTIIDANPRAEALIGLPREKIVGNMCHSFVCPAQLGKCPITDLNKTIDNTERVLISAKGEKIPILKTVAKASMNGKEYLIESFVDIIDRKKAEERRIALIQYLNEAVARVKIPLELTAGNLEELAKETESGIADMEDVRMEIRIQAKNIMTMAATLQDLAERCAAERDDIPPQFKEFFVGK